MSALARTDTSLVGRWWWTVDRWLLAAVIAIAIAGAILTMAASPPVAERMELDTFHFAKRQLIFIIVALAVMLGVSFLSPRGVRRAAVLLTIGAIVI